MYILHLALKMLNFVASVGLVGCALEFLGHMGYSGALGSHRVRTGLGLELVFGCMLPVDMICKYVRLCMCVCTTIMWHNNLQC